MPNSIISEGKTTNEAIANGLKQLKVSKECVEIKVLENKEKRSFFSILAPRNVQVELTLKEDLKVRKNLSEKLPNRVEKNSRNEKPKERKILTEEDVRRATQNIKYFLNDFCKNFQEIGYTLNYDNDFLYVEITGQDSGKLIGYRGEVLNALQLILNSIANKDCDTKVRLILDIGDYKQKREKALEELADKIAKTVFRTGKSVTLEPMMAYERKIIHNRLQNNHHIKTYSIGEEPYRKVVIAKK